MTLEVNRYRFYCHTESNYVYQWDTKCPTLCPNNSLHSIDDDSMTVIDSVSSSATKVSNMPFSIYNDEIKTSQSTVLIDLTSSHGKSAIRDVCASNSVTGFIFNDIGDGEYFMSALSANDRVSLTSVQRTPSVSFNSGEVKIGLRVPYCPSGNQVVRFGLFDDSNGFYYKLASSGLGVGWRDNGVDIEVVQSSFNVDKLDGQGPSQSSLSLTDGNIYSIEVSGAGYATLDYSLYKRGLHNSLEKIRLHNQTGILIRNGTLPIKVEVSNNGTAGSNVVYVSGRQYSIADKYKVHHRVNGAYVSTVSINSINDFVPVLSIRHKNNCVNTNVKLSSIDITTSTPQLLQIRSGGTLTTPSWSIIPDQKPEESAIEYDQTSMAVSDGIVHWVGYIQSGTTSLRDIVEISDIYLPHGKPLSLCVKNVQSSSIISCVIRWTEDW